MVDWLNAKPPRYTVRSIQRLRRRGMTDEQIERVLGITLQRRHRNSWWRRLVSKFMR